MKTGRAHETYSSRNDLFNRHGQRSTQESHPIKIHHVNFVLCLLITHRRSRRFSKLLFRKWKPLFGYLLYYRFATKTYLNRRTIIPYKIDHRIGATTESVLLLLCKLSKTLLHTHIFTAIPMVAIYSRVTWPTVNFSFAWMCAFVRSVYVIYGEFSEEM